MTLNKDDIEEKIFRDMTNLAYSRHSTLIKKMIKKIGTLESKLTIKSEYFKKRLVKMTNHYNQFAIFIDSLEMHYNGTPNLGGGELTYFKETVNNNSLIKPIKIHTLNKLNDNYGTNAYRLNRIIDNYNARCSRLNNYISDLKKFKETVRSFDFRTLSKYTMKEFEQVFYKKNGLVVEFFT